MMESPHVLHLIDSLKIGGTEGKLYHLILGLIERGYKVSVGYCTPGPWAEKLEKEGVRVTRLQHAARIDPLLLLRTIKLIRSDPPHIVHTHLFKSDLHGRLAGRLAGVPVVIGGLHNMDVWARHRPLGLIYGATARFTDLLIAVSEEVRHYHINRTGVSPEKVISIENGVDIKHFERNVQAGQKVRAELGIDPAAIVIGTVGRLKPQKDHSTFLNAAREILNHSPDVRFLVVGDGPLRSSLEAQARRDGLFPSLIFTGLRTDIHSILSALDIFVLSSLWEGLPNVLLEAMAAKLPIVASDVNSVRGLISHGKNGLLVSPSNPSSLAKSCLRLLSDTELRGQFSEAGYVHVNQKYSLEKMIDRYAECYTGLLQKCGIPVQIQPATKGNAS